ncbi:MAG: hypothetical protein K9J24_13290, partial [Bacteroidales bacterium]|nr:hypothetical protein [Bacteroidales bacterium]
MLDTLASLGEQINKNKSKFDEIIEFEPKIDADKKNYCLNIIFDIDKEEIIVSSENLEEFDPTESSSTHYLLKTFSARSGKTYVAALLGKIEHLKVSLFGKVDETKGQFVNDIDKKYPGIKDSLFYKALTSIYEIKDKASTLDKNEINKLLGIGGNESVVFCYSSIRNSSLGIDHLTELSSLPGYEVFLNKKFFDQKENEKESLCYASGKKQKNVKVSEYRSRNSMSAMFV